MAEWWIRMGANLDNHPKGVAAGYQGVAVFSAVLRLHGLERLDGKLPPSFSDPNYLARRIGAPVEWVAEGLVACERVPPGGDEGLLRREPDGSLVITGWDEEWRPPMSATERKRAQRKRSTKATVTESPDVTPGHLGVTPGHEQSQQVTPSHAESRDVTIGHGESRNVTLETRPDQKRIDQSVSRAARTTRTREQSLPGKPPTGQCCEDSQKHRSMAVEHAFCLAHRQKYGIPYAHSYGRDREQITKLPAEYTRDVLLAAVPLFLERIDAWTLAKRGASLPAFVQALPSLVPLLRLAQGASPPLNDPRAEFYLVEIETEAAAAGRPSPWAGDPRRQGMTEDVRGRPVKQLGGDHEAR